MEMLSLYRKGISHYSFFLYCVQRPTTTYICDPSTIPVAVNNYCLRDDIAAYGEDQRLNLIANGCPGESCHNAFNMGHFDIHHMCHAT